MQSGQSGCVNAHTRILTDLPPPKAHRAGGAVFKREEREEEEACAADWAGQPASWHRVNDPHRNVVCVHIRRLLG